MLSGFETIKVAIGYKINGKIINHFPYEMTDDIEPVYEELPGWKTDITNCKKIEDLPVELRNYIKYLEVQTGVKVKYLSVGPDRIQTIKIK